jgi:hypothetical protein
MSQFASNFKTENKHKVNVKFRNVDWQNLHMQEVTATSGPSYRHVQVIGRAKLWLRPSPCYRVSLWVWHVVMLGRFR